eukprot:53344_1
MISRLRHRGVLKVSSSLPCILTRPTISRHNQSSDTTTDYTIPKYERAMKKPIITGRNSQDIEDEWKDPFPNPFVGRDLPYGRKVMFDNRMEEDLAKGQHWHEHNDRFMQHFDLDFVERGWGNLDLWKSPMAKRGCDDITMSHDMEYHFKLHQMGMHLEMCQHIPHLRPLVPELKADYKAATGKWQDIVQEILGNKDDDKETMNVQENKTSYKLNSTIYEERPLMGNALIESRKEKIRLSKKPQDNMSRKDKVKREIEMITIKKFVDDKVEEKDFVRIVFIDAMGTKYYVYGVVGETLLQCARRYLVPIDGYCNGHDRGIVRIYGKGPWCHLCQMDISPKYFDKIPPFDWRERAAFVNFRHLTPTSRLGCCIWIRPEFDGMMINIPVSIPNPYGRFQ